MDPSLDHDFFSRVERLESVEAKVLWYISVIVNLSSINYPDLIPSVWLHVSTSLLPPLSHDEQFGVAQKLIEAATKSVGIVGAAKTRTSIRTLAMLHPSDLQDHGASHRAAESAEQAKQRGLKFHAQVYGQNKEFDKSATEKAIADYTYIIRDLFYGRIFSFDEILNALETEHVIVSALIGIDCRLQLRNHLKGILYLGATRDDLTALRDRCLDLSERLGVVHRNASIPIEIASID